MPSRLQLVRVLPWPAPVPPTSESVTLVRLMPVPELRTLIPEIARPDSDCARTAVPVKLLKAMSRTVLPVAPDVSTRPFVTLGLPESTMLLEVPRKVTGRSIVSVWVSVIVAPTRIS